MERLVTRCVVVAICLCAWAVAGLPARAQSLVIGPENVDQLTELLRIGHGSAWDAEFSPDGRTIAVATSVGVWLYPDILDAGPALLPGYTKSVAFSPDGARLVAGSDTNLLRLWDVASGEVIRTFEVDGVGPQAASFSPDGTRIVSDCGDSHVCLWDAATGARLHRVLGYSGSFSPDGGRVLTVAGGAPMLWDAQTGALIRSLEGHTGVPYSATFSPDGQYIATGSDDHTWRLWDAATGALLRTVEGAGTAWSVAFSPDSRRLVVASVRETEGPILQVWDVASGEAVQTLDGHGMGPHGLGVISAAFSPDGRQIVSTAGFSFGDGTARVWDAETGAQVRMLRNHMGTVNCAAFGPPGARADQIATGSDDGTLRLWSASGALLNTTTVAEGPVQSLAFSPDGRQIVFGAHDGMVRLWDVTTEAGTRDFAGHTNAVLGVAFSPDGAYIASGSADATVRLWDAASGALLHTLAAEPGMGYVWSVAFNPDGTQLVSGSADRIARVWDVASGALLFSLEGHDDSVRSVAYTADGAHIHSVANGKVHIWNAADGTLLSRLTLGGHVNAAPNPPGTLFLSAAEGVMLWDAASGALLRTLEGHGGFVDGAAFNRAGTRLISWAKDGTARVWGIGGGE